MTDLTDEALLGPVCKPHVVRLEDREGRLVTFATLPGVFAGPHVLQWCVYPDNPRHFAPFGAWRDMVSNEAFESYREVPTSSATAPEHQIGGRLATPDSIRMHSRAIPVHHVRDALAPRARPRP